MGGLVVHTDPGEAKDEQKTRVIVIVIVAVAAALIPGMLLIAYLICKSGKKFRGNVTFYDLQKTYCHIVKLSFLLQMYGRVTNFPNSKIIKCA